MAFLSPRKIFPQPKKRRNTPSDAKKNNPKNNFIPNVRKIKHSRDLAGDIRKIAVWSGGKGAIIAVRPTRAIRAAAWDARIVHAQIYRAKNRRAKGKYLKDCHARGDRI